MLIAVLPSVPSFAVTAKEKMATCKFGADDQKLAGAARTKFMKNCMANRNDPRGGAGAWRPGGQAACRRRRRMKRRGKSGAAAQTASVINIDGRKQ